jgi:hypothetical protein
MVAPNPLEKTAEDFDGTMLKEYVRNRHPAGGDHFSADGDAEAAIVGFIDNNRLRGAYRFALGYCALDTGGILRRTLPQRHPRWSNLVCYDALGQPFDPPNTGANPSPPGTTLKHFVPPGRPDRISSYADYASAELTLRFRPPPWDTMEDTDLAAFMVNQGPDSAYGTPSYSILPEWRRMSGALRPVPGAGCDTSLVPEDRAADLLPALDEVNREFSASVAYFGSMFGMVDAVPTRLAFTQIPEFDHRMTCGRGPTGRIRPSRRGPTSGSVGVGIRGRRQHTSRE